MTQETKDRVLNSLFYGSLLVGAFLFCGWFLFGQQPPPSPPDLPDQHLNPHCSVRGGPQSVRCGCLGMVGEIQRTLAARCWRLAGFPGPPPDIPGIPSPLAPPEVLACLGLSPDHCTIISQGDPWTSWDVPQPEEYRNRIKGRRWPQNRCSTACRPERCGCRDSACRAHGDGQEAGNE